MPVDAPNRIVINGRFLTQRLTGVQRVASEFTRAVDRLVGEGLYPGLSIRLAAQPDADASPLRLRHIPVDRVAGGTGHLWEQAALPYHARGATLLCLGNSAPVLSLLGRSPVAVMLHDQSFALFPADYSFAYRLLHGAIGRLIVDRARPLVTVSAAERDVLARRNPKMRARIVVAPNGSWIDDRASTAAPRAVASQGYGLYVGSFTARKNIGAIFAAARELAEVRGMRFLFVGPPNGASAAFQDAVPEALRALIEFRGYVDDDELPNLYRGAICLLYPSLYEASGLPPSEAMSFGCPVVASDIPVLRERCGDAALYCDPHRPASLVDAVVRLLDDPALRSRLAARGHERVTQFTWRNQAIRVIDAICHGV